MVRRQLIRVWRFLILPLVGAMAVMLTPVAVPASQATTAPALAAAGTLYEGENATIFHGTVDSDHTGFTGTGFCNTNNAVGASVQWTVNAANAGGATLTFRYANGSTASRPMTVTVNGSAVATLDFPPTGSWDSWATVPVPATVNAGSHTVRLSATTSAGGPNVDYLDAS